VLPLAIACGDGTAPEHPSQGSPEHVGVPAPVIHAPPTPLAIDVIDGRFGAPPAASDLSVDAGGGVWVATDTGLDVRPPGKAFFSHVALARRVITVAGLTAGLALAGHERGPLTMVAVADDGTATITPVALDGYAHDIRAVSSGARAVVAGAMGLAVVEADGRVSARRAADPPTQELWAVAAAADGSTWFASYQQLLRIDGATPGDLGGPVDLQLDLDPGKLDLTTALEACAGGDVWATTLGNGVYRLSPKGEVVAHLLASGVLPQDHVISVACEPSGGVWLGTSWGGLVRLHPDGTVDYHTRDAGLPGDSIRALVTVVEASGRSLWIATEGGIAVYRGP
jgi:ligand-binding sensor domain-containing protein